MQTKRLVPQIPKDLEEALRSKKEYVVKVGGEAGPAEGEAASEAWDCVVNGEYERRESVCVWACFFFFLPYMFNVLGMRVHHVQ